MTTGKTIALTIWTFVSEVMSLLFNTLSRFVIAFLLRSKCLLISWLESASATILDPPLQNKTCHCFHCFPSIYHEVMGPDAMILVFWMLSFKAAFSLSSFTFIKKFFSFSSLSAIRVVSPAYLRLLLFLPAIWIPVCGSSSPAFHMMYSIYRRRQWQPTPVFLPGEPHGQRSLEGYSPRGPQRTGHDWATKHSTQQRY